VLINDISDSPVANLHGQLRKAHPEEEIRNPPPKNRTAVNAPNSPAPTTPSGSFAVRQATGQPAWDDQSIGSPDSFAFSPTQQTHPSLLAREKNRLTLRAYLHSLLASPTTASSPVLKSFLLSGPTNLTPEELEDARWREEADKVREEGRKKFAREIASRVDGLRAAVREVKGDIMGKGIYREPHFVSCSKECPFQMASQECLPQSK